jgi:hypothetical protein
MLARANVLPRYRHNVPLANTNCGCVHPGRITQTEFIFPSASNGYLSWKPEVEFAALHQEIDHNAQLLGFGTEL